MKANLKLVAAAVAIALSPIAQAQDTLEKTRVESESDAPKDPKLIVIDGSAIEVQMMKDNLDTVRYIPGVDVNNTGNRFGDNGFNIRGLEGDAVAITVDGIAQGESLDPLGFSRYGMFSSTRNAVELESVKTVEILKGANSVIAGSGALGGAVMYTTKDADDFLAATGDDFAGNVKVGYDGRNSETLTSVSLAGRVGDLEGLLIVTNRDGSETGAHDNGADVEGPERGQADPFDIEKTNILAKLSYQISEEHEFGVVLEDYDSETNGTPLSRQSATYFDFVTFDESTRERIGLFYKWQANNALFDELELQWNDQEIYTHGSTMFQFSSRGTQYLRNEDRDYTQELTSVTLDFVKELTVNGSQHSIAYGIASETREVSNVLQDIRYNGTTEDTGLRDGYPVVDPSWVPDTEADIFTAYVSDRIKLNDQWTLQLGARYDDTRYEPQTSDSFVDVTGNAVQDAEFSALTWAANASYEFTPGQTIIASVGTGFKAPTTQQLYYNTNGTEQTADSMRFVDPATGSVVYVGSGRTELDLDTVSNPDLDAEEGTNYELTYQFTGEDGYLSLSVFRSDYDNFILNINQSRSFDEPLTQASFNWFLPQCAAEVLDDSCWTVSELTADTWGVPTNAGEVKVTGFEVDAGWQINAHTLLTFAYSHTSGEYTNSVQGSVETNFDSSFEKGDKLESIAPDSAVLGVHYQSNGDVWGVSGYARYIDAKDPRDSFSATFYSDSATIVDVTGFYEINENLVVRASVNNLFDEEYSLWPRVRLVREGNGGFFGGVAGDGIDRFSEPGREFAVNLTYNF